MLYLFAGPYLFRRWRVVVATVCFTAYIGYMGTQVNSETSLLASWTVADWICASFVFAGSTAALDYWDAILNTYPYLATDNIEDHARMQDPTRIPYWINLIKAMMNLSSEAELDPEPIEDLKASIRSLGHTGRSWKTMSILFPSNLRQEMCILYAWFRVCDDIVDDMDPKIYGTFALDLVRKFLNEVFHSGKNRNSATVPQATKFGKAALQDPSVPSMIDWDYYAQYLNETQLATLRGFSRLAPILCPKAAFALTEAWKIDIHRQAMKSQDDLVDYAGLISGRFAELCTCVIMYKSGRGNWSGVDPIARNDEVLKRARATGQCLQLINIARDLITDSLEGRCYVPLQYMTTRRTYKTLKDARDPVRIGENTLKGYAVQILKLADRLTGQAQIGIDGLPYEVRDGVRAAFEIYSAISPAIRTAQGFPKRAKVPKSRQQIIAFSCIYGFHPGLTRTFHNIRCKLLSFSKAGGYRKMAMASK
ncbi:Squalene/phytoene synthase-domain-containing protein [Fennellomyces sp. T-0311]|nr:Squalene/phytoene synthase-domain-containing protein [Fennellomyces sp. T-0311]